jgi:hypothetical protein
MKKPYNPVHKQPWYKPTAEDHKRIAKAQAKRARKAARD